jgi:branched-chain amino acid transport system permease protein
VNSNIALLLTQDGIINGAIYALLGVALVLLFAVTRVIFVPQGELVAWGALTMATLETGVVPGTARMLVALGLAAATLQIIREWRTLQGPQIIRLLAQDIGVPLALLAAVMILAPLHLGLVANVTLTLALLVPMGPLIYRIAFQPIADASVLVLFIAAIGVHFSLVGLGLLFFGAEGYRLSPFIDANILFGSIIVKSQSVFVLGVTAVVMVGLYIFFEHTMPGKALRATAVNRLGARLVGISVRKTGQITFALAAAIGAVSGILIGPLTTIYYDTGFLIGLKGFVAAIVAGLASYPLTVLAAILVGLLESYSAFFASAFKEVIVFSLIIPVLLVRSFAGGRDEEEE